jgi:hypothetical protein
MVEHLMVEQLTGGLVAECVWPDVDERAMRAADARVTACAAALNGRFLGSISLREDEVVLCQFQGTAAAVREFVTCAEVAFDRILESTTYRARGRANT